MRTIALIITFCLIQSTQAKNINIMDLGATPDGKTLCTDLIQKAIDDCSSAGGGKVVIPTGTFLTGTIFLKSNVTLHLENGAVLLGSTNIEDYKPRNLIKAFEAHNIGITGNGTIDGQGHAFWIPADRNKIPYERAPQWIHNRPTPGHLIQLEACKNVTIENVTLRGSVSWTLHLLACDEVLVTGIKIRNPLHGPNTDGIDIQASSNVRISNCDIYTRDDAIVLKNRHPDYYGKVCENITITNCIITTVCNAFKIGTETIGDFKNIVFSNSVIQAAKPEDELAKVAASYTDLDAYRSGIGPTSGISLETVDGSNLQGVTITNIVMDGVWTPIFIRLANRGAGEQKVAVPVPGSLKDVIISNIVAYNASTASSITAIPGFFVKNVMLKNILIKTSGGGDRELAQKELDEKIDAYPDAKMWGPMPVSGFFVRHVKGLQLSDIKIITEEDDMRPLMKFDNVIDLYVNNLQTNDTYKGDFVLDFNNVRRVRLLNLDFPESIKIPWMYFNGSETENIIVSTIDNSGKRNLIKFDKSVKLDAIKAIN